MDNYLSKFNIIRNEEEWMLFTYYKSYRANVRAKVNALRAMQVEDSDQQQGFIEVAKAYLRLMESYFEILS
jgi:aminoglycoside phosphotransferase family enzyme